MKRCCACGVLKNRDEFHRDKRTPDGLTHRCRPCANALAAVNRKKNPNYRARDKARHRKYEKGKGRAAANAKARRWKQENPGWRRAYRARRKAAPMDVSARDFVAVLLGDCCSYCGIPAETVDHIVSLARGGDSSADNLTAACRSCNSSKWATPLLLWMAGRDRQA